MPKKSKNKIFDVCGNVVNMNIEAVRSFINKKEGNGNRLINMVIDINKAILKKHASFEYIISTKTLSLVDIVHKDLMGKTIHRVMTEFPNSKCSRIVFKDCSAVVWVLFNSMVRIFFMGFSSEEQRDLVEKFVFI